jgi:uncharacterized membrane protein YhaH (DUF805 family)
VIGKYRGIQWYFKCFKQYADFNGRARRKEYLMFALFNFIFCFVAIIFDNVLKLGIGGFVYGPIYILYTLAVLIPGLAVTVRRLHDTGKSGWMILISLIPLIGFIWLLVLILTDSESEKNDFGLNPKNIEKQGTAQANAGEISTSSSSGNAGKVFFVREDKDQTGTFITYNASCKADAINFLTPLNITQPSYYVVVDTPEGSFGKDNQGLYQE